jgi:hypothetical protein
VVGGDDFMLPVASKILDCELLSLQAETAFTLPLGRDSVVRY